MIGLPVFTVVDDRYNVSVYFTLHDLCQDREDAHLFIAPYGEVGRRPATRAEIRKAFRAVDVVELSDNGDSNWKYRMVRQT